MKSYKDEKIHFVGVGGISMSALAKFVKKQGGIVSGSDREKSNVTTELETYFPVYYGEHPEAVEDCNSVVYSSAINFDNLELVRARELGVPTIERHEFLGQIARDFEKVVAVGGTHGKTTVTAMIVHGMKNLKTEFSAHVGGETEFGNLILSGNEIFVTEACEYKRSLLSLSPSVSVVLNTELDHPDCYGDMKSLLHVFLTFLEKGKNQVFSAKLYDICKDEHISIEEYEKMCVGCEDIKNCTELNGNEVISLSNGKVKIWSFDNLRVVDNTPKIDIYENGKSVCEIAIFDKDKTTIENYLFVVAVLDIFGYGVKEICDTLKNFKGVKRRKEYVGMLKGAKVVFDYAHHPTQIRNIISSFEGRNLVVFQPHTYSRTKAYFDDFCDALSLADTVVITETYGAREKKIDGADSSDLAMQISTTIAKERVEHITSISKTIDYVINHANEYDNILFLGAGDIYLLKDKIAPYLDNVFGVEVKDIVQVF